MNGIMIKQFTSRMLMIKPITFLFVYLSAYDGSVGPELVQCCITLLTFSLKQLVDHLMC